MMATTRKAVVNDRTSSSVESAPHRREVWKMFDRIARRYDLLNRLLSFGWDVRWRRRVSRLLPDADKQAVLDLATGTGDLLISLYRSSGKITCGIGLDMAGRMLLLAQQKLADTTMRRDLSLVRADVMQTPFSDNSFDAVTIAFGIRNVENVPQALREIRRVLKPSGRALILEFSLPDSRLLRSLYLLYLRHVLPLAGSVISGDRYAYRYLNETIESFPHGMDFRDLMEAAGFELVKANKLTFGIATIYQGNKLHR